MWPAPSFKFGDFVTVWDRYPGVVVDIDRTAAAKYIVACWTPKDGPFTMRCEFLDITHDLEAYA